MKREVLISDISPENLYRSSDMAKLNAGGCAGCSYCCREMTDTIILDPWDIFCLAKGLGNGETDISLEFLMNKGFVSLAVFEGLTLPHLAVKGYEDKTILVDTVPVGDVTSKREKAISGNVNLAKDGEIEETCVFLDENGRCRVHAFRPGFCRMFPLGRYYENDTFYYFLQSGECKKSDRTKVKISKWLGIDNLPAYEDYILKWHEIQENIKEYLQKCGDDNAGKINMTLLKLFYLTPYDGDRDFYEQFEERRAKLL